jgi:uncharacterized protein (DUF983 family)
VSKEARNASVLRAALLSRCPRCGKGRLFKNLLERRERCESCGLDYAFVDTGDGPAVFVIFILGCVALGAALVMHLGFGIPQVTTYMLVGVFTTLLAIGLLRVLKAMLIALQWKHQAEEGRLAPD